MSACGGGGSESSIVEPPEAGSARSTENPATREELSEFACPGGIHLGADNLEPAMYLERHAERLTYSLSSGAVSIAYRFNAGSEHVIFHSGHLGYVNESLIKQLLDAGFTVTLFNMPLIGENIGPWDSHDDMSSLCPFVEPVIRYLNDYGPAHMIGISGGGWTTVLAAAMDDRIQKSFPVSGSLPYDLRKPKDFGDFEQRELNRFADYREIYALANDQVAIQNRFDSCCFAGKGLTSIKIPGWRAVVDETHREHIISEFAIDLIMRELRNENLP